MMKKMLEFINIAIQKKMSFYYCFEIYFILYFFVTMNMIYEFKYKKKRNFHRCYILKNAVNVCISL